MKSQLKSKKIILTVVVSVLFFSIFIMLGKNIIKNVQYPSDAITGGAVSTGAQGGNVTYANATKISQSGHWQGYFGEITIDASASTPSATARGGNVTELNLILPCLGDELYASVESGITLEGMTAGTKESIDTFLNLNSSNLEAGSKVFTTTRDFVVSSTSIADVPTTFMKVSGSSESPFALGTLNESNHLVFVSNVSLNTIGFDSDTHDYQMMVPVNQSSITYYFFSDCEVAPPTPVPTPAAPSAPARAGKSFFPIEKKPIVIEIVKKEGKLLATGYPIAITVVKGEKSQQQLQIRNIGDGDLTNVYVLLSGLPLDIFIISPDRYDLLLPGEKGDFILEFQGNLEAGTYDIQMTIISDQGSSIIDGVLIVKGIPEQKLPWAGAATGLLGNYNQLLLYLMLLLLLLLLIFALWHLLTKHRRVVYHACTIEEILHHHEEGNQIQVSGVLKPIGKAKEGIFSRMTDKTAGIDVLADAAMAGRVQIQGVVQRDPEQHKYIKAVRIKKILSARKKKKI